LPRLAFERYENVGWHRASSFVVGQEGRKRHQRFAAFAPACLPQDFRREAAIAKERALHNPAGLQNWVIYAVLRYAADNIDPTIFDLAENELITANIVVDPQSTLGDVIAKMTSKLVRARPCCA
jgi:hypothetical protein